MAFDITEIANKCADANVTGGGTPIKPGIYKFALLNFLAEPKRNGRCVIIELLVKESRQKLQGVDPNMPGSTCSYVVNLDASTPAAREMAPANVKAFVCALGDMDPKSVDKEKFAKFFQQISDKSQPLRGMLIGDDTFTRPIKNGERKGQDFTGHNWIHVAGQSNESVAAERKALEAAGLAR
jgi:hypothetical protein